MRKLTKILLGLASFFAILGIVSIGAAFMMGFDWNQFMEMAQNGELAIQKDDFTYENHTEHGNFTNLDIEFSAGSLNIVYEDVKEIEIHQEGMKNFNSRKDGNTLEIRADKSIFSKGANGHITVIVPKGYVFEKVDLEMGAGQADISDLRANILDIEVGAGQADLSNIDVQYFNASAGAGQIQAEIVGNENDYNYDVECGIGEIMIGNNSYGGFGRDTNIENPGAERKLDVECGVGQIVIEFQE